MHVSFYAVEFYACNTQTERELFLAPTIKYKFILSYIIISIYFNLVTYSIIILFNQLLSDMYQEPYLSFHKMGLCIQVNIHIYNLQLAPCSLHHFHRDYFHNLQKLEEYKDDDVGLKCIQSIPSISQYEPLNPSLQEQVLLLTQAP